MLVFLHEINERFSHVKQRVPLATVERDWEASEAIDGDAAFVRDLECDSRGLRRFEPRVLGAKLLQLNHQGVVKSVAVDSVVCRVHVITVCFLVYAWVCDSRPCTGRMQSESKSVANAQVLEFTCGAVR